jgi:putative membrane-bound dehydrogenase-like protein
VKPVPNNGSLRCSCLRILSLIGLISSSVALPDRSGLAAEPPLRILFLGDRGHHHPRQRFNQVQEVFATRGIDLTYTEDLGQLSAPGLAPYHGLAVYANIDTLPMAAEAAILAYVRGGGGLVPIHCASFCFRNSPAWIDLVGGQFLKHGSGEFRTVAVVPDHPILRGFGGFQSWDETYVHTRHNDRGRTVLEERVEDHQREPWTWVRQEGRGRVFYTAWGHDERTWSHPGFQNLLERGIRFAAGRDPTAAGPYQDRPEMTRPPQDLPALTYQPARIPFYRPGGDRKAMTSGGEEMLMQQPLAPEPSRLHAVTPVGFRVELFASEPLLTGKPLAMCFDADGVVYVAESVDYPNELAEPPAADPLAAVGGHDRIVRLIDTDGDGRADRREVFAEKLSIPTSMLAHDGGLIVTMAPNTLFLRDTDGDGVADQRKLLFTGWGTRDTHAGPSNLTWGLDGWVYGIVGYSGFEGTVGGEAVRFPMGFFRFRPDGSKLEYLRSTNNNSWGFGFSEEGLVFGSTANGNPSEHMPLANRVYERVRGWSAERLGGIAGSPEMQLATTSTGDSVAIRQVDHHGRFTAAAGHRLYTARNYPPQYWNRTAFVCEPTGHIVATFALSPRSAGFTSRMAWNLVASDDEWTAPIQCDVGPDGQVWVIDWYNFIVQHNPTPAGFETGSRGAYVTPLRDKTRGRIWRVVHEAAPANRRPPWSSASPNELVETLRNTNMFWRERAQRKLVERAAGRDDGGRDVVPALIRLIEDPSIDELGLAPGAIHAVWTLEQLGALVSPTADPRAVAAVQRALVHPSAGVRMNAIKALPRDRQLPATLAGSGVPADPAPLVRLAALEALGECPASAKAGAVVTTLLEDPRTLADPVLADAATSAAAVQAATVLPRLLAAAGASVDAPRLVLIERVAEHVARGAEQDALAAVMIQLKGASMETTAALTGLARGWPAGTAATFGPEVEKAITHLADTLSPASQGQLVTLVQKAGSRILDSRMEAIGAALLATLDRSTAADADRLAAAERLVALRPSDPAVVPAILERIDGRTDPTIAAGLLVAAGHSTAPGAADAILDRLAGFTPQVREAAIRTVLGNRDWAKHLVNRLEQGGIRLDDIPILERTKLAGHPDRGVRDRMQKLLAAGGGLPSPDRQRVIDDLLPIVRAGGDAIRGQAVFTKHCGTCHRHGREGGRVGPDLTGMAVHPAQELLIHILDPNRSVEGNYRAYTATTEAGRVVTGLLAAESRTAVEIMDAEGKRIVIQRDDIDELVPSPNSLMPVGFEKQIPAQGFADLLAFLTQRGRFLPLPLAKAATAVSTRGMFHSLDAPGERLVFDDWTPKQVHGVPFVLVDPRGESTANVVLLQGPLGTVPPLMPREVTVPVNAPVRAIHLLGGVAGWGFPAIREESVSMIVRLRYQDGTTEDHPLLNGRHIADYIRRVDVPDSEFAFDLHGKQLRYLRITPEQNRSVTAIDLVKGNDKTAALVMAMTVETP